MSFLLEVLEIVARSVAVSGMATILASSWCVPMALYISTSNSRLARVVDDTFRALTGVPTVVVGLLLYMLLSKRGLLGWAGLLYTPMAMSIGQSILITPLVTSLCVTVLRQARDELWETLVSLGATPSQARYGLLVESLQRVTMAMLIGFNRALGELGVALMVGGNVSGLTRVMTTSIALEITRGNFELALALGGLMLTITLTISLVTRVVGRY